MEMRRAGMVLVAAVAVLVLFAFAAFAQTAAAGASVDQSTTESTASATTTTGTTTTAPSTACPPGTVPAGTAATSVTTTAVAGQPIMTTGSACGVSVAPPILNYASLWNAGGPRQRISGRIISVDQYYPAGGSAAGTEVTIGMTTEDSESVPDWQLEEQPPVAVVQLGPSWFVDQNFGHLRPGDDITVYAVPTQYDGHRVLLAHAASVNGHRMLIADRMNCPMWAGGWQNWGSTALVSAPITGVAYNPSTVQTVSGKIEHVWTAEPVAGMGQNQMISIRQSDNTVLNVALAPAPFVSQSGIPLTVGDQVSVTGSLVTVNGQPLLLASQFQEGGSQFTLRDVNGNPAWTVAAAAAPAPVASTQITGPSTSASASASVGQPGSAMPSGSSNQPATGAATPGPQANAGAETF